MSVRITTVSDSLTSLLFANASTGWNFLMPALSRSSTRFGIEVMEGYWLELEPKGLPRSKE